MNKNRAIKRIPTALATSERRPFDPDAIDAEARQPQRINQDEAIVVLKGQLQRLLEADAVDVELIKRLDSQLRTFSSEISRRRPRIEQLRRAIHRLSPKAKGKGKK